MKLDAEADVPGFLRSYLYATSYASLATRTCRHGTDSDRVSRWMSTGLAQCSKLIASFVFVGDLTVRLGPGPRSSFIPKRIAIVRWISGSFTTHYTLVCPPFRYFCRLSTSSLIPSWTYTLSRIQTAHPGYTMYDRGPGRDRGGSVNGILGLSNLYVSNGKATIVL